MAGKNVASFFHQNKNISPSAMVERGFVANPRSDILFQPQESVDELLPPRRPGAHLSLMRFLGVLPDCPQVVNNIFHRIQRLRIEASG
jgi:hypothetical protein